MAAFFSAAQTQALASGTVRYDTLIDINFPDPVRLWNGYTTLLAGGRSWRPMYGALQMPNFAVGGGLEQETVTIAVGLGKAEGGQDILAQALASANEIDGRQMFAYLQFMDEVGGPIGSPLPLYWGLLGTPIVSETAATPDAGPSRTVSVTATNIMYNRARPAAGRYTDLDQKSRSPDDGALEFVSTLNDQVRVWPV